MPKTIMVKLLDRIDWHNFPVIEVEIKEPTGALFATLGEPRVAVQLPGGAGYWVEQTAILSRYADQCIAHEGGADLIRLMSLRDVMQVKDTILGFFLEARDEIWKSKPEALSST
jgi:hypothetical protein